MKTRSRGDLTIPTVKYSQIAWLQSSHFVPVSILPASAAAPFGRNRTYLTVIAQMNSAHASVDDTVRTWFHIVQSVR